MPLVPYTYQVTIEVIGESGLLEGQQVNRVGFYKSNNNPYAGCKSCVAEKRAEPTKELTVYPRRTGSAYCVEHAEKARRLKENVL